MRLDGFDEPIPIRRLIVRRISPGTWKFVRLIDKIVSYIEECVEGLPEMCCTLDDRSVEPRVLVIGRKCGTTIRVSPRPLTIPLDSRGSKYQVILGIRRYCQR